MRCVALLLMGGVCLAVGAHRAAADATFATSIDAGRGEIGLWLPPETEPALPYDTWSGEVEFGTLVTSGNANTESAQARARIVNDQTYWKHSFRGEWVYTKVEDAPPAEQYRLSQKSAYKVTEDDYVFGAVRYDRSETQGIRYRFTEVLGYGRRLYQEQKSFLALEAGGGGRQTRTTDADAETHEFVNVVQTEFNWVWLEGSVFNTYLVMEFGELNTLVISQTSLTAKIRGNLSVRLSYDYTSNSQVPDGIEKVDRVIAAGLVYQL